MKNYMLVILILFTFVDYSFSDQRKVIFEGFDSKIVKIIDDMTDEESGVIFIEFANIYFAVYSHNTLTIWANSENLHFASDEQHLIRIGTEKPIILQSLSKRDGLKPSDGFEAEEILKAIIKGEEIKIRYYTWPQYQKIDLKIQKQNLGFVYHKAMKIFGWKDLGVSPTLALVELDVYIPTDPSSKGYATVTVKGNRDLGLRKKFDAYGGGCYVKVGINDLFGIQKGRWCCEEVDLQGKNNIIIRDSNGEIKFKATVPNNYNTQNDGNPWPFGQKAAIAAWNSAPLGTIEFEGVYGRKVLLYGFKELWQWGVENANFPSFNE